MRLRATRTLHAELPLPDALKPLRALAYNLFWTWHTDAAALFARIDPSLWEESGHNPVRLLQSGTAARWTELERDDGFRHHLDRVYAAFEAYRSRDSLMIVPGTIDGGVIAYFSLEFALTESFPNYSGGLGVLAGDHLKSASDLGLPLVGVGLLYSQGYFQQSLGADGWQQESYSDIDLSAQPVQPVLDGAGEQRTVLVPFEGRDVVAAIWRLEVGQTRLLLLDTNVPANTTADRAITARLYGGDIEMRIKQEMVVGIGGVRALHVLGLQAAVCHMNEGHSALLGVERIRMMMEDTGATFEEARIPVTAATAFTTHTAVAAGIDLFPPDLVRRYLAHYYEGMGLDSRTFLGLGRTDPDDDQEPFSMALLGLRLSGFRNGVSKLHRTVSQKLWESAWPHLPQEQIPIDAITNGVHLPTWVSHEKGQLYDRSVGPSWRDDPSGSADWGRIHDIPDAQFWETHQRERERLISRAREQHAEALLSRGLSPRDPVRGQVLDPRALTVGFARRFAGYKRATLLFQDPERLAAIVNNSERPVQFIFAGKAHPRDEPAKQLIREVLHFSQRPEFRDKLVLLERYDVELARALVQGCDVWLNTPLRPLEASGTSGMKAAANGALNVSVMDGWWWEAYRPGLGWAVGRNKVDDNAEAQDAFDADSLYNLLEHEVAPSFYDRDADGIPQDWVRRMKASVAAFAPVFNTSRMVAEYAEKAYGPAAGSWRRLREDGLAVAREQAAWQRRVEAAWPAVEVLGVADDAVGQLFPAGGLTVTARVNPGGLKPDDLRLDLIFGRTTPEGDLVGGGETCMTFLKQTEDGVCSFQGILEAGTGGRLGYIVRLMPEYPELHDPLATGLALWA